jgi:hypothetical protein
MEGRQIKTEDEDENEDEGDTGRTSAWQKRPCPYGGSLNGSLTAGRSGVSYPACRRRQNQFSGPRVVLVISPFAQRRYRRTTNFISC